MSARAFLYDRQLDEYNTEPSLSEINQLVNTARRAKDVPPGGSENQAPKASTQP
jgi:hypothetical protein